MERKRTLTTGLVLLLATPLVQAAELVQNGGFEDNGGVGSSTFTGWTVYSQPGSDGALAVQSDTVSPQNGFPVEAPPEGGFAAMTDQIGPGAYALYQDIAIPVDAASVSFSAQILIDNKASDFATPATLDYTVSPNQQFRVDILDPAAGPQDLGAAVLENLFLTNPGDPLLQPYQTITADLSAYAGQTIRLRFAETDNSNFFNVGIDAVSVDAATHAHAIPTTGVSVSLLLSVLTGLAGLAGLRRRVKQAGDGMTRAR